MPLVTAAVLVYCAALLAASGRAIAATSCAVAIVIWHARGAGERYALAAIALAAGISASVANSALRSCQQGLLAQNAWELTLRADAAPGEFVPASHACSAGVRMSIVRGRAPLGAVVMARGEAFDARGAILIKNATIRIVRGPSLLPRWRSTVGKGIDARFGEDAPLVRALIIADMRDLSPTLRDRFAAAGLSHMLSVSGLHVGLIAAAVSFLAQLIGIGRRRADALVISLTAFYVLVIGAPLPAVRAAIMLGATSLSLAIQRPTSPWAVLAVGAAAPIIDPSAVLDLGFQLSIVGMVALIAAGSLVKRWEWLGVGGWRGTLYRGLVASTAATLLTAPLVAGTFGRVSLAAPLSNLVAVPVMAVLQPMLFLAVLLLPIGVVASFVADACKPLLAAIDWLATTTAQFPGASINVVADAFTITLACAASTALVVAAVSRFPGRSLVVAVACLAAIAWRPLVPTRGAWTELHMIDVGQGDALAIRSSQGRWVMFDAGRVWDNGDAGRRDVIPYVLQRGGTLAAFVLTHPHADHVGGASSVIEALKPSTYLDPGYAGRTSAYRASLLAAQRSRSRWRRVRPGDSLIVDEVRIAFLAPDSVWADTLPDPNDASTVALVRIGIVSILLTGDAERDEEAWLLDRQPSGLRADILKVAHHGSSTSTTQEFLDAVGPRLALVSVGAGNIYRHPSPEVMERLATAGALTLRTDRDGSITVHTDGQRIEVEARGERWRLK
jgi:competence protein ComEC